MYDIIKKIIPFISYFFITCGQLFIFNILYILCKLDKKTLINYFIIYFI